MPKDFARKPCTFELVDRKGKFILKPQTDFPELPENEDLTMHLAEIAGFNVPLHGLIYAKDQSLYISYKGLIEKDTARLLPKILLNWRGESRETKYSFNMERLVSIIEKFCTFPVVEKSELFKRTIFNYLVGNEDMHLKNFSVIVLDDLVRLAPVYDFVNSTLVLKDPEDIALPLDGKKSGLTRKTFLKYFGEERLGLEPKVIDEHMQRFAKLLPVWSDWVVKSFLSPEYREKFKTIIQSRAAILQLV